MQLRLLRLQAFMMIDTKNVNHLMGVNLKHKGLEIPASTRVVGGAKTKQVFNIPIELAEGNDVTKKMAVSIDYLDVVESGVIKKIQKVVKYYNNDGSVYCQKNEEEVVRDEYGLIRSRCKYAYDYLWNTGKVIPPLAPVMAAILNHYSTECAVWQMGSPEDLINALGSEADETILSYLSIVVDGAEKTVRDATMEQLTGIKYGLV